MVRTPRSGQEKLRNSRTGIPFRNQVAVIPVDFQARRSGPGAHGGAMPYKRFEAHVLSQVLHKHFDPYKQFGHTNTSIELFVPHPSM